MARRTCQTIAMASIETILSTFWPIKRVHFIQKISNRLEIFVIETRKEHIIQINIWKTNRKPAWKVVSPGGRLNPGKISIFGILMSNPFREYINIDHVCSAHHFDNRNRVSEPMCSGNAQKNLNWSSKPTSMIIKRLDAPVEDNNFIEQHWTKFAYLQTLEAFHFQKRWFFFTPF